MPFGHKIFGGGVAAVAAEAVAAGSDWHRRVCHKIFVTRFLSQDLVDAWRFFHRQVCHKIFPMCGCELHSLQFIVSEGHNIVTVIIMVLVTTLFHKIK